MARRYTLDGRLGKLVVRGNQLTADLAEAVTRATLDLSTSEVTQLDLTVSDPELKLLGSRLFEAGTPTKAGSPVDYGGLKLEVRRVTVGPGPSLNIVCRDLGAYKLKRAKGPHVRNNLSPTDAAALDAKAVGLRFVGEPSAKRPTVAREKDETAWDALGRLAEELGYLRFVNAGVLYFGRPTFLRDRANVAHLVRWAGRATDGSLLDVPSCTRSGDDTGGNVATVDVELYGGVGDLFLPGGKLVLAGVPTFDGDYLVDRVTLELDNVSPVRISASTATNPVPAPPDAASLSGGKPVDATLLTPEQVLALKGEGWTSKPDDGAELLYPPPADAPGSDRPAAGAAGGPTPEGGSGTAEAFVKYALDQAGDRYTFGAEARASDPDPDAFDCSELVEWALARAGVKFVDGSVNQIARAKAISVEQGIRTRGALLFRPGSPNHIAISLGNGRTIEARGRKYGVTEASASGRFTRAGLVPGLRYS